LALWQETTQAGSCAFIATYIFGCATYIFGSCAYIATFIGSCAFCHRFGRALE